MAPSALSPFTARGHPETCLVSVSIGLILHNWLLNEILISVLLHNMSHALYLCVLPYVICVWLPGVVAMSRVQSSLLLGECVWGESRPWLSWTQMCWTACTHWVVSETESSSHVTCNVKSKHFSTPPYYSVLLYWHLLYIVFCPLLVHTRRS